jgi:ribosome biogenesis GTPase A
MPGVLWPKFDDQTVGENLAMTGAIKDAVVNTDELSVSLCARLRSCAPELFCARYKLGTPDSISDLTDFELFELIGRKRGFLISGGEIDYERTANILLDEYRGGKIGRITLELPQ